MRAWPLVLAAAVLPAPAPRESKTAVVDVSRCFAKSDRAREIEKELEKLRTEGASRERYREKYDAARAELLKAIRQAAERVAKERGYDLVLRTDGGEADRAVLYHAGSMDVTDEVLRLLNDR